MKIKEEEKLKKRNVKFILLGYFLSFLSVILITFLLPFYLKEKGLTILEIGALFTFGLAFGGLVFSIVFSKILRKIKLKSGLSFSAVFSFLTSFLFFIIPNYLGAIITNFNDRIRGATTMLSSDVALQHNVNKKEHRKISSYLLVTDSGAIVIGLIISLILVKYIGFRFSFLIFSLIAIPAFFIFNKVKEETRFKLRKKIKLPKINFNLKLILFVEIVYWLALASSFTLVVTFLVTDLFSETMNWIAFLFIALYTSITVTTLLTNRYMDRLNLIKTSIFGMVILFLSPVLIILSKSIYLVLFAMILEGVGAGVWVPSKMALYWRNIKPELREKVSGYLTGWRTFVTILGPLVGGLLVFSLGILAPFYFRAFITLLSIFIYILLLRKS